MIEKEIVEDIVKEYITTHTNSEEQYQIAEVSVSLNNDICVTLDALVPIGIDFCAAVSQYIAEKMDRDIEDYSLVVGSAGLTDPFRTPFQYKKNIGNEVVVLLNEGKKMRGLLVDATDSNFSVDIEVKVAVENKKRKQTAIQTFTWDYADVKSVVYDLKV